jgi:DNA-binding transcriptional LysR family regulator
MNQPFTYNERRARGKIDMELSDLKIFQEVVLSGGITAAAQKLNRVPSNITARIQKLEQELETQLFVREKNRLRISPAGEQLLPYAKQMINLSQQAINELQQTSPKGHLSIGAMEAVAATRLTVPLMNFHKKYPEVDLQIETGPTGLLIEKVLSGRIDVALVADPNPDSRLDIHKVFEEELVLVSDLSHKKITHKNDLSTRPTLLSFNHLCAYRGRMIDWAKNDSSTPKVIEISSYHTLLSCVAAGMGVGIVPKVLLDDYPFSSSIQQHTLGKQWRLSSTAMIWRKDSLKPSMVAFHKCILEH